MLTRLGDIRYETVSYRNFFTETLRAPETCLKPAGELARSPVGGGGGTWSVVT